MSRSKNNNRNVAAAVATPQRLRFSQLSTAIMLGLGSTPLMAASAIVALPGTGTEVKSSGSTVEITGKKANTTVFNNFSQFNLGAGDTANLTASGNVKTFVNLVHSAPGAKTQINGTLNSVVDSKKGSANVIFADANGVVVGATGVVNVGSLTLTTPTSGDMQRLKDLSQNSLSDDNQTKLISGLMQGDYVGGAGSVEVNGTINTEQSINLFSANQVVIGAGANLTARGTAADQVFVNTVNLSPEGAALALAKAGQINVQGTDVSINGHLQADANDEGGGQIVVHAKHKVSLGSSANLEAQSADGDALIALTAANAQALPADAAALSGEDLVESLTEQAASQGLAVFEQNLNKAHISVAAGAKVTATDGDIRLTAASHNQQVSGIATAASLIEVDGQLSACNISLDASSSAVVNGSLLSKLLNTSQFNDYHQALKASENDPNWNEENSFLALMSRLDRAADSGNKVGDLSQISDKGWTELTALIPNMAIAVAQADAKIVIGNGAALTAQQALSMQVQTNREVEVGNTSIPNLTGLLPFNPALSYGRLSGESSITVAANARLNAETISLASFSDNSLELSSVAATSDYDETGKGTRAGFSLAIAHTDLLNQIVVDPKATLVASGDISLTALTQQAISNEATFKAIGKGALGGPALALSLLDSQTRIELDGEITADGNLSAQAVNLISQQTNSAEVSSGLEEEDESLASEDDDDFAPLSEYIDDTLQKLLAIKDLGADGASNVSFRLGSANAVGIANHSAEVLVGSNGAGTRLEVGGDVSLVSQQAQLDYHNKAISAVSSNVEEKDGSKTSLSVAASYAQLEQNSRTLIGDGTVINADRLGAGAFNSQELSLDGLDRWSSFADVLTGLRKLEEYKDDQSLFATNFANATGEAEDLSLAGSITVTVNKLASELWVGDGAELTLRNTGIDKEWSTQPFADWEPVEDDEGEETAASEYLRELSWDWQRPLDLHSANDITQVNVAGDFLAQLALPDSAGSQSDSKALGGNINVVVNNNRAIAGIGKAKIRAEAIRVKAEQDELTIAVAPAGGKGTSIGASGALVVSVLNSTTQASMQAKSDINAQQVEVLADHRLGVWSAAGAVSYSGEDSVGGSIAINVLNTTVDAFVGDDPSLRPSAFGTAQSSTITPHWAVNTLIVDAQSSGQSGAFGVAAALAKSEKEEEEEAKEEEPEEGEPDLMEGLVDALKDSLSNSLLGLSEEVEQVIEDAEYVKSLVVDLPLKLKSTLEDIFEGSGDTPASGETNTLAVAGSLTINQTQQKTRARLWDVVLDPREPKTDASAGSDVRVSALNNTHQYSAAGGGALTMAGSAKAKESSAVGAAIAFNNLGNQTEATVEQAVLNNNRNVEVLAASGGDQVSMGLGLAGATGGDKNKAVGASVSLSVSNNQTLARVQDSQLTSLGGLASVVAYDRARQLIGGGSFALSSGGGDSVGGALALSWVKSKLQAQWLGGSATGFNSLAVQADSALRVYAGAIGAAVSSGQSSDGKTATTGAGSSVIVIMQNMVEAQVDKGQADAVLQGAALKIQASSLAGSSALDSRFDAASSKTSGSAVTFDGAQVASQIDGSVSSNDSVLQEHEDDSDSQVETREHKLLAADMTGETVFALAGSVAGSKGRAFGAGLSVVYAGSDYSASLDHAQVDLSGDLAVLAQNRTEVVSVAIAAAAGSDTAAAGTGSILFGRGSVSSTVNLRSELLNANSLSLSALRSGQSFSLAGSLSASETASATGGAFSIIDSSHSAKALLISEGAKLLKVNQAVNIRAGQSQRQIGAAISVAGGAGTGLSGALSYNRIADNTLAQAKGIHLDANSLSIQASLPSNDGANIKSLAFVLAGSTGGNAGGAAIGVNLIDASRQALLTDSTVTRAGAINLGSSLNGEIWGLAASAAAGSGTGAAGSFIYNQIEGEDKVLIENSTLTGGSNASLSLNANAGQLMIASLAGAISGGGSNALGGAISVNNMNAQRLAQISHSAIKNFTQVNLAASLEQSIYAIAIAGGGAGTTSVQVSSSTNLIDGKEQALVDDSSLEVGGLSLDSSGGERTIWSLAGSIAGAGTVAVGVANTNNLITSERNAGISGSTLSATGQLRVSSGGASNIRSAAVGGGGAGQVAAGASVAYNQIKGKEQAFLDTTTVTNAQAIAVQVVQGQASIQTLAGNVQGAGAGAGAGAVAISIIDQQRNAEVINSGISSQGELAVAASTQAEIKTIAVSGAGAGAGAGALSNATNQIHAKTTATLTNSSGSAGNVQVVATDNSSIQALAGAVAGAGAGAAGVGTAINTIGSHVSAAVSGSPAGLNWRLDNLKVEAGANSSIESIAISAAGAGAAAGAVTLALNDISSTTQAQIAGGARVLAKNIGISAHNNDRILGISGSIAGAGVVGIGALTAVNQLNSHTLAGISGANTQVTTSGGGAPWLLDNGQLIEQGSAQPAAPDSAGVYNPFQQWSTGQQQVNGLAIQASALQQLGQMSTSLAASFALGSLSSASLANVGVLGGSTEASINDATVNSSTQIKVGASSHQLASGYLASTAAGGGASLAAVIDSMTFNRITQAVLNNAKVTSTGKTQVEALSSQQAMSLLASTAAGVAGAAANAAVINLDSQTRALIHGSGPLNVGSLNLNAHAQQRILPLAVSVAAGVVALGGNTVVISNSSQTQASLDDAELHSDGVAVVSASNSTNVDTQVAGISAGGVAVAGSALVVRQNTQTQALVNNAQVTAGSLQVKAEDQLRYGAWVGTVAGGGLFGGGASANVLVANSQVLAGVQNSTVVSAGELRIEALRQGTISLNTVTGAVGASAIGGSVGVILLGDGALSISSDGEQVDPLQALDQDGQGTLSQADRLSAGDKASVTSQVWDMQTESWVTETNSSVAQANQSSKNSQKTLGNNGSQSTIAQIIGGDIRATGAVTVEAKDLLQASNLAGNAVAGVDAVGEAMALSISNARVQALVLPSRLSANALQVNALATGNGQSPALKVSALSGSAGLVGLGAAIGVGVLNNQVQVQLGGQLGSQQTQALSAMASDTQNLEVEAKGLAAGSAAAGLVLGLADHASQVSVLVNANSQLEAQAIALTSVSDAAAKLTGRGTSAGILGGLNAVVLTASDRSQAKLLVGNNADLNAGHSLALEAKVSPQLQAYSEGISLGGVVAAGGVLVLADVQAKAELTLADNVRLQATQASLISAVESGKSADDEAAIQVEGFASSGAGLVAANAVLVAANSAAQSLLSTGANNQFIGNSGSRWTFSSNNDISQSAKTTGLALGYLAVGAHVAEISSSNTTLTDVRGSFSGDVTQLQVSAWSQADNLAQAQAGQGGIYSGAASLATTADNSSSTAKLWVSASSDQLGKVGLSAIHIARVNSLVDSSSASMVGASGAWARNSVTAKVLSELLDGSQLSATDYEQTALGKVVKADLNRFNVISGSGGAINAAAGYSYTTIDLDTQSKVGAVNLRVDGDWRAPGNLAIQALNEVEAYDTVKLDSGGAIAVARVDSKIDVSRAKAAVNVTQGAVLYSVGDLILAASGQYTLTAIANAKTYGLAGAAQGVSLARVNADYQINVEAAQLFSYGDIRLYAGLNRSAVVNKATLSATTNLWNNTALPVVNDPEATANYTRDSLVNVASGARLDSVSDIYAYAVKGNSILTGEGYAKDLYREALGGLLGVSLETRTGSTVNESNTELQLSGVLNSGAYSQRKVTINGIQYFLNGELIDLTNFANVELQDTDLITLGLDAQIDEGISYDLVMGEYSQFIGERIATLQTSLLNYGLSAAERTGFQAELNLLNITLAKMAKDLGISSESVYIREELATLRADQVSERATLQSRLDEIIASGVDPVNLPDLQIVQVNLDPIRARAGNIYLQADKVSGSGELYAPGDATIEIVNNSPAFLNILGLEVPDRTGGHILFNNADITATDIASGKAPAGFSGFSQFVEANGTADPKISVISNYSGGLKDVNGYNLPTPDIYINGAISNRGGEVKVQTAGSIYANGDIRGKTLNLSAGQNFVLNNADGFTHVSAISYNGTINSTKVVNGYTDSYTTTPSQIVANNNVVINALYLNINGLIQSGVADWSVEINAATLQQIEAQRANWKKTGGGPVRIQLTDAGKGLIGFSYDFSTESVVLDKVEVAGGYMELTGHMISTGNGELKVLDGYSQVRINNTTDTNLNISGIDLGDGVEGHLRLNDLGRDSTNPDLLWSTEYKYDGQDIVSKSGWTGTKALDAAYAALGLDSLANNSQSTFYQIDSGRTYVWLQGQNSTETSTEVRYWDQFWDFIPTGDGTLLGPIKVVKGELTPIEGAEYMGSSTNLSEGTVLIKRDEVSTDGKELISQNRGGYCHKKFIWCQVYRTTVTRVYEEGKREITRYTVKADNAVKVSFNGYSQGKIEVNSLGNLTLADSLYNGTGVTSLTTTGLAGISQANDQVTINSDQLVLNGANGLGDSGQALGIITNSLRAVANAGNIYLANLNTNSSSSIDLLQLSATAGDVHFSARNNVISSNQSVISGNSIDLSSRGSLGTAEQALWVQTRTDGQGKYLLSASGDKGVYLTQNLGDLWVDQITASQGDVQLTVAQGALRDGNSSVAYDQRSLEQLQTLWDSMDLQGAGAATALAEQQLSLEQAGKARYERYWALRHNNNGSSQDNAQVFDLAQAQLSDTQKTMLAAQGWSAADIEAEQSRLIADYSSMHDEFGAGVYDANFAYQLSSSDLATLQATSSWGDSELRNSISSGLLSRGAGSNALIEAMNIHGRNVVLQANAIGSSLDQAVQIDLSNPEQLSDLQKAALVGAQRSDIVWDDDNSLRFSINQRDDFNLSHTVDGSLSAQAEGNIYIGSDADLRVNQLNGDNINLITTGSILAGQSAANQPNISANNLVINAYQGDIGSVEKALSTAVTGVLQGEGQYVHLAQQGDLLVDRMIGTERLSLQVTGNLNANMQQGENLLGGSIDLTVSGQVGSATQRVQLGTGGLSDSINLSLGGDAWVGGLQGVASHNGTLRLGAVNVAGQLNIGQSAVLQQSGNWALGSLNAIIDHSWSMAAGTEVTADSVVHAELGQTATLANLTASDIELSADQLQASEDSSLWQASDTLSLATRHDIGQNTRWLNLQGLNLALSSTQGAIYANLGAGSEAGTLLAAGPIALNSRGDLVLDSVISQTGAISLTGQGVVTVDTLAAQGAMSLGGQSLLATHVSTAAGFNGQFSNSLSIQQLTVSGNSDLTAGEDVSLTRSNIGGNAVIRATGDILLASSQVTGNADVNAGGNLNLTHGTTGGDLRLTSGGAINVGDSVSTGQQSWTAGTAISFDTLTADAAVSLAAQRNISGQTLDTAATLLAGSTLGTINLAQLTVSGNSSLNAGEDVSLTTSNIGGNAVIRATGDILLASSHVTGNADVNAGGNLNLTHGTTGGDLRLTSGGAIDVGDSVSTGQQSWTAGTAISFDTLTADAAVSLAAQRNISGQTLDTAATLLAGSTLGTINLAQLTVSGNSSLNAGEDVSLTRSNIGGDAVIRATGDILLASSHVTGNADVNAGGNLNLTHGITGGDLRLTSGGAIDVGDSVSTGQQNWTAGTAISFDTLTADAAVSLAAQRNITGQTLDTAATLLAGSTLGTINLAQLTVSGNSSLNAGEDVSLTTSNIGGNAVIRATGDILLASSQVTGNADVNAGGDLSLTHGTTGGDLLLTSGGAINVGDSVSTGQQNWTAGTAISFDTLTADAAVSLAAQRNISGQTLNSAATLLAGSTLGTINLAQLTVSGNSSLNAGEDVSLTTSNIGGNAVIRATGDILLASSHVTGNADVNAGGNLNLTHGITGGDLRLTSGGAIDVGDSVSTGQQNWTAGGTINFDRLQAEQRVALQSEWDIDGHYLETAENFSGQSRQGNVTIDQLKVGKTIALQSATSIALGDLSAGQDILLNAARDIRISGQSQSVGSQQWTAGNTIQFGLIDAQGLVNLQSGQQLAGQQLTSGDAIHAMSLDASVDVQQLSSAAEMHVQAADQILIGQAQSGLNLTLSAGQQVTIDRGAAVAAINISSQGGITSNGQLVSVGSTGQSAGIYLNASGDISAQLLQAMQGDIQVQGRQLSLNQLSAGQGINLLAQGGITVNDSQSGAAQQWQSDEDIAFGRLLAQGQVLLDSLLNTQGGLLQAGDAVTVNAGWRNAQATPANILLDQVETPDLSLRAGQQVQVNNGLIGKNLHLNAEDISFNGRHTGTGALQLWIGGLGQAPALKLHLELDADEVDFNQFEARNSGLQLRGSRFAMNDAANVDFMHIRTPLAEILIDNLSPAYRSDADVQLYQMDKTFSLRQDRNISITNSYVVHRTDDHQVLLTNFSAPHKLGGNRIQVQGITAARYAEQQMSEAIMVLRLTRPEASVNHWPLGRPTLPHTLNVNLDAHDGTVVKGMKYWTL